MRILKWLTGDNPELSVSVQTEELEMTYKKLNADGANSLFSETFSPDGSGDVIIRSLAKFMSKHLGEPAVGSSPVMAETIPFTFVAIYGGVDFDIIHLFPSDAEGFGTLTQSDLIDMPLSRSSLKKTAVGLPEVVGFYDISHAVGTAGKTIKADVIFLTDGMTYQKTIDLYSFSADMGKPTYPFVLEGVSGGSITLNVQAPPSAYTIDSSVSCIAEAMQAAGHEVTASQITEYRIYSSDAEIHYEVIRCCPPRVKTFLFKNSFHTFETLHCWGDLSSVYEVDRTNGIFQNRTKAIDRNLQKSDTAYTGFISEEMCGVVEDALTSRDVHLFTPYGWFPVVINDNSFEITDRLDKTIFGNFTFKAASLNQKQFRFLKRKSDTRRIFDSTFDDSFN